MGSSGSSSTITGGFGSFPPNPPPTGQAQNYRGLAYAAIANMNLGTSSDAPNISWEVQFAFLGFGPDGVDASPADILVDILTNNYYGLGFPVKRLDTALVDYRAYTAAAGLVCSWALVEQQQASTLLADLLQATNSSARWTGGQLTIVPWGDGAIVAGAVTEVDAAPFTIPTIDPTDVPAGNPTIGVSTGTFVEDLGVINVGTGLPLTEVDSTTPGSQQYNVSGNGLYTFSTLDEGLNITISYRQAATGSYSPDVTPVYDLVDGDWMKNQSGGTGAISSDEPIIITRKRRSDMLNSVKVEFLDRFNNYDPGVVEAKDEASITTYGLRASDNRQLHMFSLIAAAKQSAELQLIREQIPATYAFTLPSWAILLDIEDIVTLTRPNLGLNRQPVRITEITENDDKSLGILAETFLGTASVPLYGAQGGGGYSTNINVDPGGVSDVLIFEPPSALATPPSGQLPIWGVVCGSNPNYGGSNVFMSTDGDSYNLMGNVGPCTMGFLTAPLPSHADPDAVNTLSVDLTESNGNLQSGTATDVVNSIPACFVDSEIVAYQTATLTGPNNYNLTTLKRGGYGSTIAAHDAGCTFALLNQLVFQTTVPSSMAGQTVFLKFQPYNVFGRALADLSSLPVYTYVIGTTFQQGPRALAAPMFPPNPLISSPPVDQQGDSGNGSGVENNPIANL